MFDLDMGLVKGERNTEGGWAGRELLVYMCDDR
jgi:hypothetical protein